MDPQNRKLRVLTIGAGISGILMAYRIQKDCQNVEHVIYEKNRDIGGLFICVCKAVARWSVHADHRNHRYLVGESVSIGRLRRS